MYDLAIIGAGPAGIACAKSAVSRGLRTVLIEKERSTFGGTCLNSGCIPTKFFINSLKSHKSWENSFKKKGEIIEKIKFPLFNYLENQGVDIVWGESFFLDKNSLKAGEKVVKAKNIVVAAGSLPRTVLKLPKVIFARELFSLPILPDKILIIGAGYIGMELASLLHSLGRIIYVIEKQKYILPGFDSYFANRLKVILEKKGIKIDTDKSVFDCDLDDFDIVISAAGRVPNTAKLKTENIGLLMDDGGWIKTDKFMRTNIENIYACGDITGKKLLAYIAEYQARICIDNLTGKSQEEDYKGVAECVFSLPQAAKVGILEEEARSRNIEHKVIKSNFLKFSSSYVYGDIDGFIKIVVDREKRIIGAGIISQAAGELISIFSLCIKNNLRLNDLKKCLFIHPTLSEIIPLLLNASP